MSSRAKHTLHFNGSHNSQNNNASAGCIIRDKQGDLVVAAAYNLTNAGIRCDNVFIAEAMGLKNGLLLAKENSLKLNHVKGDNREVIDLVLGYTNSRPRSLLSVIISEIRDMLDDDVIVEEIDREDNKVADRLANKGSSLRTCNKVIYRYPPSQIADQITKDKANSRSGGRSGLGMIGDALAVGAVLFGLSFGMIGGALAVGAVLFRLYSTRNIKHDSFTSYTLQYFGSDRNQLEKARAGCIITNNGSFVVASAHNLDHQYPGCNIAIAEAIALKMGPKLAKDNKIRLSLIQGRNVEVRDLVLGQERRPLKPGNLSTIIGEIKYALEHEQRIDPKDGEKLELVGEDEIGAARELAIIGGTLDGEIEIYPRDRGLPDKVACALANY